MFFLSVNVYRNTSKEEESLQNDIAGTISIYVVITTLPIF